jgi:protein TonB
MPLRSLFTLLFFCFVHFSFGQVDSVYEQVVDQMPRWPGCDSTANEKLAQDCWDKNLWKFLDKNLTYPSTCMQITGKVWAEFIIEQNGTVTNLKIIRGLSEAVDEEVIRVIKLLPVFFPARNNNQPVRFKYRLPVNFTLK